MDSIIKISYTNTDENINTTSVLSLQCLQYILNRKHHNNSSNFRSYKTTKNITIHHQDKKIYTLLNNLFTQDNIYNLVSDIDDNVNGSYYLDCVQSDVNEYGKPVYCLVFNSLNFHR